MPVRSLNSSVLRWPDATEVKEGLRAWTERVRQERPDILRIGYIGSYARGTSGVGSDADIILVVEESDQPFVRRSAEWDATSLPVPVDIMVYTRREWESLPAQTKFHQTIEEEAVWLFVAPSAPRCAAAGR